MAPHCPFTLTGSKWRKDEPCAPRRAKVLAALITALLALFTLLKVPCNHLSLSMYTVGPLSAWCTIDSLLHSSCSLTVHEIIISRRICFGVRIPTAKKADLELICHLEIINSVVITILCVSNRRITQCVLSCREPATCFIRAAISDMLIRAAMSDMPTRVAMTCLLEQQPAICSLE
jgi:hypothetical protein